VIALAVVTALLAYTYVGYPALLALLRRLRPRLAVAPAVGPLPSVTVIVPARDEAGVIGRKLSSLLLQDYPPDRIDIIVVSDGSRDETIAIASGFGPRVAVLALAASGKPSALNRAVLQARGDILVLTDARQPLCAGAVRALVARFCDPQVGAVTGEIAVAGPSPLAMYRRYDDWIRRAEASGFGSAVGVTGALWALRRELYTPAPPETLCDDLFLPLMVIAQRRRVACAPDARAIDSLPLDPRADFRRRVRTLAGNFQLLGFAPWLLSPRRNPAFFAFLSHKVLRLASPALLCALAVLSFQPGVFAAGVLAVQVFVYGLALVGCFANGQGGAADRLARAALAFVMVQVAIVSAALAIARRRTGGLWRPRTVSPPRGRAFGATP
jgi:cellulose synthase/poly-beta-1,6-N-acetylglucosamine synthase-like glycosyltransferase